MEKIYEIVQIKQVVKEAVLNQVDVIRSPERADVARHYISDDDREVFLVLCLSTKNGIVAAYPMSG